MMSSEQCSPSLLGHRCCPPARAIPPSSRAPSLDLPPTHSPGPGPGGELLVSPLGACLPPYKLWAPLGFQLLGPNWNCRVLPLVLRETEAQNVPWPEASEPGFKLRAPSSHIPARVCPAPTNQLALVMIVKYFISFSPLHNPTRGSVIELTLQMGKRQLRGG